MSSYANDPFITLIENNKVDHDYWKSKAGSPSYGLQDDTVIALRKMGYNGTISDMLRGFYRDLTGKSHIMDAWAALTHTPDTVAEIDYIGKVRGDGDTTRRIYYGALPELSHPLGLNEAGSAMGGVSYEDDASVAYYDITSPGGYKAQLIFHLNLSHLGTKEELKKRIRELKFYQDAPMAETYVFDNVKGLWFKKTDHTQGAKATIDISDNLDAIISSSGDVFIGYLAPTAATADGLTHSRVEVDYFKLSTILL